MKAWITHETGLKLVEPVPGGVTLEVCPSASDVPSDPAEVEFWSPPFGPTDRVRPLLDRMSRLRVVQLMSAGADSWIGQLPERVTLCDARGVHDSSTSEWVVTAILAYLRRFPSFARAQARREWIIEPADELAGKRVLIIGAGSIGTALARRLAPFEVDLTLLARQARPESGIHGVGELPELLPHADIVVLLLPLTPATAGLVDATFLAALPSGALLVNGGRGPVVDTEALTEELATGRICAALDVTDPEPLPAGHPLWSMPNVLITPHVAGSVPGFQPRVYQLIRAQLQRLVTGEPLVNIVADGY